MSISNFNHIKPEYPTLASIGQLAERNVFIDPSTSMSKLRLLVEKLTEFILEFERLQYLNPLGQMERLRELENKGIIPYTTIGLFHKVRMSGNKATHTGEGSPSEAKFMLKQTLKIIKWFYSVYENEEIEYKYNDPVPHSDDSEKVQELESELEQAREDIQNFQQKLSNLNALSEKQIEERKQKASEAVFELEESEAEIRELIDLQLREAGWECDTDILNYKTNKIRPEKGRNMAIAEWKCGEQYADYALFIGTEIYGIVEAKKDIEDVSSELTKAKNYSKMIDGEYDITFPDHDNDAKYRVPFMFASNGQPYLDKRKTASGVWFWDGRNPTNSNRPLPKWFTPKQLKHRMTLPSDAW